MTRLVRLSSVAAAGVLLTVLFCPRGESNPLIVALHAEPDPCLASGQPYAHLSGNTSYLDNYAETYDVDSPCWSHTASWIDGDPGGAETADNEGSSSCTAQWEGSFQGYYDGYSNHWVYTDPGPWQEVAEHYQTQIFIS